MVNVQDHLRVLVFGLYLYPKLHIGLLLVSSRWSSLSTIGSSCIWFMLLMPVMCKGRGGDMLSWLAVPMMCVRNSSDYYCPLVAGDHSSGSTIR